MPRDDDEEEGTVPRRRATPATPRDPKYKDKHPPDLVEPKAAYTLEEVAVLLGFGRTKARDLTRWVAPGAMAR